MKGLSLRTANLEDGPFLLAIRNAEEVRSWSKNQGIISDATHRAWLESQLQNLGSVMLIVEHSGQSIGYLRAQEKTLGTWLVSLALEPRVHGKGFGRRILEEARKRFAEIHKAHCLVAEVIVSNTVATNLFEGAGFVRKGVAREAGLELVQFELHM